MNNAEKLAELDALLDEMSEICADMTILVEGTKDRMAMTLLGVNAKIITVQSEGGPLKVAERIAETGDKAMIMTDWDKKGNQIAKDLIRSLSSLCVPYDISIRGKLKALCGNEVRDVESLPSFYCRLVTESVRKKESINK